MIISCGDSESGQRLPLLVRGKVLENKTIIPVKLTMEERNILKPRDTVWVNVKTGRIDNEDSTAMKVVLYRP